MDKTNMTETTTSELTETRTYTTASLRDLVMMDYSPVEVKRMLTDDPHHICSENGIAVAAVVGGHDILCLSAYNWRSEDYILFGSPNGGRQFFSVQSLFAHCVETLLANNIDIGKRISTHDSEIKLACAIIAVMVDVTAMDDIAIQDLYVLFDDIIG